MKLCITMMSNRPEVAKNRWLASVNKLDDLLYHIPCGFSFIFEEPFKSEDAKPYEKLGPVQIVKKRKAKIFNWWPDRNGVIAQQKAKYYLMTDDDCRFGGPTPKWYESWKRYYDAVKHLDQNKDCGGVICLPFLGGSPFGHDIMLAERELFALGSGLILRKIPGMDYSLEAFNKPGALDEPAACFSRIERGYYISRTFNTPTSRPPTKRVEKKSAHAAYDDDYINTRGIGSVIRSRYNDPSWHHNSRRIPSGCLSDYHISCTLNKWKPKYAKTS